MVETFSLPTWSLSTAWWRYWLQCAFFTVGIRAIFFLFRAGAVVRGDFPDSAAEPGRNWPYWRAFWVCFGGFSEHKAHADFWLNALIGLAELAVYPVLFKVGYLTPIGGWLALKTAGSWTGWKVSRTSFNRFLFCNLLELAVAYFWLLRYVRL